MKSSCILIGLILLTLKCASQQEQQLQGLWNSSWIERTPAHPNADAAYNTIFHNSDLYFEGNSMWRLEYPCKRISVENYSSENFKFITDSTFDYNGERYSRINVVDSGAIARLKLHELNSECYVGRWNLIRTESGGDGTGVVFIFPYEITDSIILAEDALNQAELRLLFDGVERRFDFRMERHDFQYELILTPTKYSRKKDLLMWTRYWELPPPKRRELKKIKKGEGIELELRFTQQLIY